MASFLSDADWRQLQLGDQHEWLLHKQQPVDPYMWWIDATDFRSLSRNGNAPVELSFIAEGDLAVFDRDIKAFDAKPANASVANRITVEPVYFAQLGNGKAATFWTLRVDIESLSPIQVKLLLLFLIKHPEIKRLQMGFPRGPNQVPPESSAAAAPQPVKPTRESAVAPSNVTPDVVIGIIDDGCAFAHAALRDPGANATTRMAVVWNQSKFDKTFQDSAVWARPINFNYGAVTSNTRLDRLMARPACTDEAGGPDELACYQAYWSSPNRGMRGRESHGAAVAILAAGNVPVSHDAAAKAPIIFVDLPLEQVEISSGRWMPVNGLDAVRFIIDRARSTFLPSEGLATLPVVINLSSGSNAGAHDGTAMFERAMDEVLAADDYVAITLAAGNSRLSESHLQCSVTAGTARDIGVFIPHSKKFETYVEIWLPKGLEADALAKLTFTLHSPDGQSAGPVALANAAFIDQNGTHVAGIHFCRDVVQSVNRAMVLVVIAATNIHPIHPYAMGGCWRVTVNNTDAKQDVVIDAWIERDEVVFGARRPQSARFYDDESAGAYIDTWQDSGACIVQRSGTMSNIATGTHTFAVAASTGDAPGFVSPYSGAPLATSPATASPAFAAKADRSPAQPGILVHGNLRSAMRHMNGTSVAAPQAARWIAKEMANGRTRSAIAAALPTAVARIEPHVGVPVAHDGRRIV